MKNEIKILIAAIVVILIILVGAFALSGSSPQPSATPTAVPVTATPTPVPANGGSTATATPAPTVAPTATPTPTPTPEPESGVKQTEFGYWITYPPLPPQNWSTNPPPNQPEWNVVYFDPTSETIPISTSPAALTKRPGPVVYRLGDLNGTVNVTIYVTNSGNIKHESYEKIVEPDYDYSFSMHADDTENMTGPDDGYYVLMFGPGVSEQELCLHINPEYFGTSPEVLPYKPADGWVKLTITGADGGFGIGYRNQYTLSIDVLPEVRFDYVENPVLYEGILEDNDGSVVYDTYVSGSYAVNNGSWFDVFIPIVRDASAGTMTVGFWWSDMGYTFEDDDVIVSPFTFTAGQTNGIVKVSISKGVILDAPTNTLRIGIDDRDDYSIGYPTGFSIRINEPV
jgi:hypothetical protein